MRGYTVLLLNFILNAGFMGFSNLIDLTESHVMDNTFTNIGNGHSCLTALNGYHSDGYVYSAYIPGHFTGLNNTTAHIYSRNELLTIDAKQKLYGYKVPIKTFKNIRHYGLQKKTFKLRASVKKWITNNVGVTLPNLSSLPKDQLFQSTSQDQYLQCGLLNAGSIFKRDSIAYDYMIDNQMDILLITETWINNDEHMAKIRCSELNTREFRMDTSNREKRGGGVGIVYDSNIKVRKLKHDVLRTFQYAMWEVIKQNTTYNFICVYRPPSSSAGQTINCFVDEFSEHVLDLIATHNNIILCGDFNIHVNDTENPSVNMFCDMMDALGFQQHVSFDTHREGHTIDLVFTEIPTSEDSRQCVECQPGRFLSDHRLIGFSLSLRNINSKSNQNMSFRKLKEIDMQSFKSDLEKEFTDWETDGLYLNEALSVFNKTLDKVLDKHAPITSAKISVRKKNNWFTPGLRNQKRVMRRREHIWKKYRTESTWTAYTVERKKYSKLLKEEKTRCYSEIIRDCGTNMGRLYQNINKWTGREGSNPMPDNFGSDKDQAEMFADYFISKIKKITDSLEGKTLYSPPVRIIASKLANFTQVTCEEVQKIIKSMPTKSCEKDHLTTGLLKECLDVLISPITDLVNISLSQGVFATEWKEAIIRPLLKKAGMELICKNYRPVSNLPFLSKLVEKAVLQQTNLHCETNAPLPDYQSAYRPGFSCETALANIVDDILWAFENQEVTQLCLMDLSAAFDTVNHQVLLEVLEKQFGIEGTALCWFRSYLENRRCTVNVGSEYSTPQKLNVGVPQGSLGGPVMYSQYASTLQYVVPSSFKLYGYADDHCIKKSHKPTPTEAMRVSREITSAMSTINDWMNENRLKLNNEKTEYIMLGSKKQLSKCSLDEVTINNTSITRSDDVKYLGVYLDSGLTFKKQIATKCRAAMNGIRLIRNIRNYLTDEACKIAIQGLVISHLDYANVLYLKLPDASIKNLQRVQDMAAKLITKSRKYDSTSAALHHLHWLPIQKRIKHKALCFVYKCVVEQSAPAYLREKFQKFSQSKNLRSNSMVHRLKEPYAGKKTFADRAISVEGTKLWNKLPNHLKSIDEYDKFKKCLKTYLY